MVRTCSRRCSGSCVHSLHPTSGVGGWTSIETESLHSSNPTPTDSTKFSRRILGSQQSFRGVARMRWLVCLTSTIATTSLRLMADQRSSATTHEWRHQLNGPLSPDRRDLGSILFRATFPGFRAHPVH